MYWLTKLAKNKLVVTLAIIFAFGVFVAPNLVYAACDPACTNGQVCEDDVCVDSDYNAFFGLGYAGETGLGGQDVRSTIAQIINVALGLLGIVAVVIVLAGGFKWMTAGGNEEKTTEARKLIFAGIIGLAIILSAYAIARFVLEQLYDATGAGITTEEL